MLNRMIIQYKDNYCAFWFIIYLVRRTRARLYVPGGNNRAPERRAYTIQYNLYRVSGTLPQRNLPLAIRFPRLPSAIRTLSLYILPHRALPYLDEPRYTRMVILMSMFRLQATAKTHCISAVAYATGEDMHSDKCDRDYHYNKTEVTDYGTELPENAPMEYEDIQTLWSSVEAKEQRIDAQECRSFIFTLPNEFSSSECADATRAFARKLADQGMCVTWAVHDVDGNKHAHLISTLRSIDKQGNWMGKTTSRFALDDEGNRIPVIDPKTGQQKIRAGNRLVWERETVPVTPWCDWNVKDEILVGWRHDAEDAVNSIIDKVEIDCDYVSADKMDTIDKISIPIEAIKIESITGSSYLAEDIRDWNIEIEICKDGINSLENEIDRLDVIISAFKNIAEWIGDKVDSFINAVSDLVEQFFHLHDSSIFVPEDIEFRIELQDIANLASEINDMDYDYDSVEVQKYESDMVDCNEDDVEPYTWDEYDFDPLDLDDYYPDL